MVFANGAALHGMDAGMLADLGLFHSVTERTDYHSKTPSPLNPFHLFEAGGLTGEALRGLQGGIITFVAPDVWTSGGLSIVRIFLFFQLSSSSFLTIISMLHARFLDSEDLVK